MLAALDDGTTPKLRRIERRIEEQLRELADDHRGAPPPENPPRPRAAAGEGAPLVDDDFDARVESELRSALGELNALVARHNLKVPLGLQIPPLSLDHLRQRS